ALVAFAATFAAAQTGVQVTRDGKRTLVSKDVGAERWAITLNEDGSVTGNVFRSDGGEPSFVACTEVSREGDEITFDCSGADRCPAAPCDASEWTFIARVPLSATFFEPSGEAPQDASALGRAQGAGERPSGVQITPDRART